MSNVSFSPAFPLNPVSLSSEWQEASLDVKSFFGFEATVEKIAMKQYSANISKGKEIIEHFIQELAQEGITEVPPWKPGTTGKLYASDVSP